MKAVLGGNGFSEKRIKTIRHPREVPVTLHEQLRDSGIDREDIANAMSDRSA